MKHLELDQLLNKQYANEKEKKDKCQNPEKNVVKMQKIF